MSYDLVADFRNQRGWCEKLGSPFTAALLDRAAQAIEAGEEPRTLLLLKRDWRAADVAPLRFAGALHWLVLSGQDAALAREYPAQRPNWNIEDVWRAASAAMARDPAWFIAFFSHAPQTNETRRAFALMPAFHAAAGGEPLHMWELGASAGLNMHWDRFAYDAGSWSWGAGPLTLTTDWRGSPPLLEKSLIVSSRGGCDVNPLDIRDEAARLRLKSYIWADQRERLERFDAAAALALEDYAPIAKMDAAQWLEGQVARGLAEGATILYHSIAWQYFPNDTKARAEAAIAAAAKQASDKSRFAWVRFEYSNPEFGEGKYLVDMQVWPGAGRRILAEVDPHVRWIEWR